MLKKLTIENFKSFSRKTTIDFSKTNYTLLSRNCTDDGILKGTIFVGANASGKSNILAAIKILLDLLFRESNINLGILKCVFNPKPTYSLTYVFRIDGHDIEYGFKVDREKGIVSENLFSDGKNLLKRINSSAEVFIANEEGTRYDDGDLSQDSLFLRTLYFNTRFSSNDVLRHWMEFLRDSVYINAFETMIISNGKAILGLPLYLKNYGSDEINNFFSEYGFRQRIEYTHKTKGMNVGYVLDGDESNKMVFFKRDGIEDPIPINMESTGNQSLLQMLPSFLSVVKQGGMLLIDEFSSGFHNELEYLLVKYFMEKAVRSQLIFVSHSTNLLSNSLLRPDQEYSISFNGKEGSSVKRFSSEQPRTAQNVEKMYLSGVFGGLPDYEGPENEDK